MIKMELRDFTLNPSSISEDAPFPVFSFPKVIGHFSIAGDGSYTSDLSQLKYSYVPREMKNVRMDLNEGLHLARRKIEIRKPVDTSIDSLLWWIKENIGRIDRNVTNFVCYRGLLRLVMTTPYETATGEPWVILATSLNGVIYLSQYETDEQLKKKMTESERMKTFASWGFKFEQFVLTDEPGKPPDTSQPVDEREEFCCMFKSNLDNIKLYYGAEMDGVDSENSLDVTNVDCLKNVEFIEVKTNRLIENFRQQNNFERFKLLKWWCQSYLVGIKDILCGFRDDEGIVRELEYFPIKQMHRLAKGKWKPTVCMNFCKEFLNFVQEVISTEREDSKIIWRFIWQPGQPVRVFREYSNDQFAFLPKWFVDCQKKK